VSQESRFSVPNTALSVLSNLKGRGSRWFSSNNF